MEEIKDWVGKDVDIEAEFDLVDEDKDGKIVFQEMIKWALLKNMKIELKKSEEKEKALVKESGENEE